MPTRSLNSSVVRWPAARDVEAAARAWAIEAAARDPSIVRIVAFGSLAAGRWGVGSDLDLFIELARSDLPIERRALRYATSRLPVPADLVVWTSGEVERARRDGRRFIRQIDRMGIPL